LTMEGRSNSSHYITQRCGTYLVDDDDDDDDNNNNNVEIL